ncbi:fluoride efflux transporter CrcB [Streptomyces albidoflavus]|uniref:fluoride efflux transporter CrcB n=1 Tax=Streptomyces TaxID=1883 RepID=UPI000CD4FB44|nr:MULTISPECIES: fluoride efflux transporter CrcB [Streptomyces]WSD42378.1 fluoride efflux transporter CrcB [Streptomyces albidoflavus]WTC44173.1 fluoride efflux transporter CrcB [Streptomyces albidoflavus]WTD41413.1 fluoride efflux transporter CrcB [Streptomyces albidoflavus]WTD84317.1 fluoride efflux transporter CrcB [Streptomyces albidoflavus]WTD96356.1 fluoride efflux transporter CrcB [Streptomyces albidoflavus]
MHLLGGTHRHPHPDHSPGSQIPVVTVVALGGAVGALLRYSASRIWRNGSDASLLWHQGMAAFPWTTLLVNVVGCFLMGVLAVALKERFTGAPRLLNPMLGTGVLGGFTTFSSYSDDTRRLIENGQPLTAVGYLLLTAAACMAGIVLGVALTRLALTGGGTEAHREGGAR